jgi:hypothetical protein
MTATVGTPGERVHTAWSKSGHGNRAWSKSAQAWSKSAHGLVKECTGLVSAHGLVKQ